MKHKTSNVPVLKLVWALKVAVQTNTEEEHGQERKLVGAEGL